MSRFIEFSLKKHDIDLFLNAHCGGNGLSNADKDAISKELQKRVDNGLLHEFIIEELKNIICEIETLQIDKK